MHNVQRHKIFCVTNSSNGLRGLFFEDVVDGECGFWARVCDRHAQDISIKNVGTMGEPYVCYGGALCDVLGCKEPADFYIDFKQESFVKETECIQ